MQDGSQFNRTPAIIEEYLDNRAIALNYSTFAGTGMVGLHTYPILLPAITFCEAH